MDVGALGTVVFDEVIAPVVRIEMRNRSFVVTAQISGPVAERAEGMHMCRLHGSDGSVVMTDEVWSGWPAVYAGDTLQFSFAAEPLRQELE